MISIDQALAAYDRHVTPLPTEALDTRRALNRVLATAATYADDLPRFDQSALDGYALRAADVAGASPQRPVRLPLAATVAAGAHAKLAPLPPGQAVRIFTGAPLPSGADTMQPQERAQREGDTLLFTSAWPANHNIRRRGEEARAGAPLADAGQRIGPGLLAALVNAGVDSVRVHRAPRIRILVTGDELRPLGSTLQPGEIIDSNGPLAVSLLRHWGYAPAAPRTVRDDPGRLRRALGSALDQADLVLTCGGASVGERDFLADGAAALGVEKVFWRVAQKPAKPLFFGYRGSTLLLGLPGNPGAVLMGLLLHARHLLDRLEGARRPGPTWFSGRLAVAVARDARRDRLLRMRLHTDDTGVAWLQPLSQQESHMLGNLAQADVLVRVPAGDQDCAAGSCLRWTPLPG